MKRNECIAMVLAGGQGTRLGSLTKTIAKPAVPFGGQYRIIDFVLSNCKNSGLNTVGILTQYQPLTLHAYVADGAAWELNRQGGGVHILPPYVNAHGGQWYAGTADAIYQNCDFINHYRPQYVVVLSGDHIYQLDYSLMLDQHKKQQAEVTIAVREVQRGEANRWGVVETAANGRIVEFADKPNCQKNNQASIGVYIFNWDVLQPYLIKDACRAESMHDFEKDIVPAMLADSRHMCVYQFNGYWKAIGTLLSYWEANMDLLGEASSVMLNNPEWPVYSPLLNLPPHYHGAAAKVKNSLIGGGAIILGKVENSVIFPGVYIGSDVMVKDSIIMSHARIEQGVTINHAIVAQNTVVSDSAATDNETIIPVASKAASANLSGEMELAG